MKSKLRLIQPTIHINDKQGQRKLNKMLGRVNRPNPNREISESLFHSKYAPRTGSNCYNRWAWLYRP